VSSALTEFEFATLGVILNREAPQLSSLLPFVSVADREFTGVGVFVFLDSSLAPSFGLRPSALGSGLILGSGLEVMVEGFPESLNAFLCFDKDGSSFLEIVSNGGDSYPVDFSIVRYQYYKTSPTV
jgi:hypothetical protein